MRNGRWRWCARWAGDVFLLAAAAIVVHACTHADGAPAIPELSVVAAGDTAKLFVSWTAASRATGATLTILVTASNGTWTGVPTGLTVAAGGSQTIAVNSATADSATFQACMASTGATGTSPKQACSLTRQWKRTLQPPVVSLDSVVGLIVAPNPSSLAVGSTVQLCAYYSFQSGHVAMRTQDGASCAADYSARFSVFQKAVTNTEQLQVDAACQRWQSSAPTIATVTTEAGCTGLGWLWMGVPIDALRST